MSLELKEGVKLKAVYGPQLVDGAEVVYMTLGVDPIDCRSITVEMQTGQMAMIPWAKAVQNNGTVNMINLALMEQVVLLEPEE